MKENSRLQLLTRPIDHELSTGNIPAFLGHLDTESKIEFKAP